MKEAIIRVREGPKPLALYPFSKDKKVINYILEETSSGGVCVNDAILQVSFFKTKKKRVFGS